MTKSINIAIALILVYLVWGTSYLAIRVAVQEIPPFLFCSIRLLIAAPLMLAFAFWRGEKLPASRKEWLFICGTAVIMQVFSSGFTAWGQQWVPSGETALIMSSSALWIAWFGSFGSAGDRVSKLTWASILLGLAGLVLLMSFGLAEQEIPFYGYGAILIAAFCWSAGSMVLRRYTINTQSIMTAALHIMVGAVLMGVISYAFERPEEPQWSSQSITALFYLAFFNSFLAYAAYYWLIHATRPVILGTFAYVTPAIAIMCGVLLLGEVLSAEQLFGSALILASVFLLVYFSRR
ncbi:MAG: EamA family transporter [Porticoccaceae bacterium]|nr:EamA family transporter [Pseudomonadales bacterium]MCP5171056.1 EamA family transporter [Pseudomonadales bacterium]MCP5301705.1 EamA family transporter [Pseudomonadales bacterium]